MSTEAVQIAALEKTFMEQHKSVNEVLTKIDGQVKETGAACKAVQDELKAKVEKEAETLKRLDQIEAKFDGMGDFRKPNRKGFGDLALETKAFEEFKAGGRKAFRVNFTGDAYRAIVNATGANQPLVPEERVPGIQIEPNRRLTIRDLIPKQRTSSNFIFIPKEDRKSVV